MAVIIAKPISFTRYQRGHSDQLTVIEWISSTAWQAPHLSRSTVDYCSAWNFADTTPSAFSPRDVVSPEWGNRNLHRLAARASYPQVASMLYTTRFRVKAAVRSA